ncbi:hypothetical protein GGTG_00904 [Gaeumannomyces tritici R3-111a-1]|uniref:Uncharacterized protein n=1 Tax=Gaeumannomyces tritici (strain R3-111a-1) TaxID=644352 RepID=J3NI19_GAET3|nr:hypothetical protein GGTG_00904 [Gaeumannomyces tritici R3-111a-1]EJT80912.1 hypothetical protein GGTG_00904 [Gaeumannomyces tritici R3-111a-1]
MKSMKPNQWHRLGTWTKDSLPMKRRCAQSKSRSGLCLGVLLSPNGSFGIYTGWHGVDSRGLLLWTSSNGPFLFSHLHLATPINRRTGAYQQFNGRIAGSRNQRFS